MKVLLVCHWGEVGGAERSLLELASALQRRSVTVFLACPGDCSLAREASRRGVTVTPTPMHRIPANSRTVKIAKLAVELGSVTKRIRGLVREHQIDLVHTNSAPAQVWAGPAAALARVPCLWHWRDFYDRPRLNRLLARTATVSLTISNAVHRFAREQLGAKAKLSFVSSGVTDQSTAAQCPALERSRWGIAEGELLVLMLGQSIPRKGHRVLLEAMARLASASTPVHLLLLCPQPDETARCYVDGLRQLTRCRNIEENVTFLDGTDDVGPFLRLADVVVVPSVREPFGRVAVEAMLAQRPVIASAVDGLAEIVVDDHTGLLVSPQDPDHLARAILELANAPARRERLGKEGRKRALECFSVRAVASKVLSVYTSVLEL